MTETAAGVNTGSQNHIITMIVLMRYCPGPGWVRVTVKYIVSELTGQVIVPAAGESFWTRA